MADCTFCNIQNYSIDNRTYGFVPKPPFSLLKIIESQHFWVTLDIAPLVENHCLLIPKQHLPAFAYIKGEYWNEAKTLLGRISDTLYHIHGFRPTLFEHGVRHRKAIPSCCIDHAHIHIVPIDRDVTINIKKEFPLIHQGEYDNFVPPDQFFSYLYYKAPSKGGLFFNASKMPSQYLRRVFAEAVNLHIWNWHDYVQLSDPDHLWASIYNSQKLLISTLFSKLSNDAQ